MKVLVQKEYRAFLNFLPLIRSSATDWHLIEARLTETARYSITETAEMFKKMFQDKDGMIYVCSDRLLCILVASGLPTFDLIKKIENSVPGEQCRVDAETMTPQGITKLELMIAPKADLQPYDLMRISRDHRIVLIADDDMYMRFLVKKATEEYAEVFEATSCVDTVELYKKHAPDLLFLDIHMPGGTGMDVIGQVLAIDPNAYIVMVSSDSSKENVLHASHGGARGFLAKPFMREKVTAYLKAAHVLRPNPAIPPDKGCS